MLEQFALNVGGQITPFADEGGAKTFQNSALRLEQVAGFIRQGPQPGWRPTFLVPTVESVGRAFSRSRTPSAFFLDHSLWSHISAISAISPDRQGTAAMCAHRTAGVDVLRTYRTTALDASYGRKARLRGSPREGPERAPKPAFHIERETWVHRSSVHLATLRPNPKRTLRNGALRAGKSLVKRLPSQAAKVSSAAQAAAHWSNSPRLCKRNPSGGNRTRGG